MLWFIGNWQPVASNRICIPSNTSKVSTCEWHPLRVGFYGLSATESQPRVTELYLMNQRYPLANGIHSSCDMERYCREGRNDACLLGIGSRIARRFRPASSPALVIGPRPRHCWAVRTLPSSGKPKSSDSSPARGGALALRPGLGGPGADSASESESPTLAMQQ